MKTKEELVKLKEEYESLNKKLEDLSEEELLEVTGGGPLRPHKKEIHNENEFTPI